MEIVNVMANVKIVRLEGKLDLLEMTQRMTNIEYSSKRLQHPAVIRIRKPVRATFLVYSSGSVICTGSRSKEEAEHACRQLLKKIQ